MSKGRDSLRVVSNPPNPWEAHTVEWLGDPPKKALSIFEDKSRSIIAKNDSPDLAFDHSVNPYRGCYHGCAYCYARRSHQHLGFGAGTDFERKLIVKPKAAALLQEAFDKPSWKGELIVFSGNTDCYQPLEASYELTRQCLEVCLEYKNPVGIVTKGTLVERDIDLIAELHQKSHAVVLISIPFWDEDNARAIEPYVASPRRRVETIRKLARANIPVGVMVSPIIPGLNDTDIFSVLEHAHEAGARFSASTLVRLSKAVEQVFVERLQNLLPLRADRVLHQIEDCRGGELNDARFGDRMRGVGERWQSIALLYESAKKKLGYGAAPPLPEPSPFRRPEPFGQQSLFD